MKTALQLLADGLDLLASSSNGAFLVTSYIARTAAGVRVHGHWDTTTQRYIEVATP